MEPTTSVDDLAQTLKKSEANHSSLERSLLFHREVAGDLIAEGYRKPRTITTVAELHRLPEGSAIQTSDSADVVVLKSRSGDFRNADGGEVTSEMLWSWGGHPFTILWEPSA